MLKSHDSFREAFLIVNHISRSWRLTSPPSMGTIQEPRASNLFYNVNRWLSNHSMHSKRTHALKPRRFVTMWSGRKMEQSKILTNLITFATAAKYLTEGLNKYICGGQLIHYTQPNPRFRTTKSVCRIQVQPNPSVIFLWHCLSLYLSFFRSFFFICLHGALLSWTRFHSLRTSQRSISCSPSTDLQDTSRYTHHSYSRNRFN